MSDISETVVSLHCFLDDHGIAHAFGGALALCCYAEPRGTRDIDVNLAVPFGSASEVVSVFSAQGYYSELPPEQWLPIAGVRLRREDDPVLVDLFFSFDSYHDELMRRVRWFPFRYGGGSSDLPFLSPDDLAVVKISFNRPRDWVDIDAMLAAGTPLDAGYVEQHLVAFRGPTMYPRVARLRQMIAEQRAR